MLTTSTPSYHHNVFCPTAGTYSSYYYDALRANSRRSNRRVSLVRNTLPHPQQMQNEQKNDKNKSLKNKGNKKKSVRFSENNDQVRLFYQWQAPQQQQQQNDGREREEADVPYYHHQLTPTKSTATVSTTSDQKQQQYQLELVKNEKTQGATTMATKKNHLPLELKSIHVAQEVQAPVGIIVVGNCHVVNLAFEKHVTVRYTFDNWTTFTDIDAMYRESLADSAMDRFAFEFPWDTTATTKNHEQSLQFALRYFVNGMEFWDNNDGDNYCARLHVLPTATTKTSDNDNDNSDHRKSENDVTQQDDGEKSAAPWSSFHQQKDDLSRATAINPWTTSSFWANCFSNSTTSSHFPSLQQQSQRQEQHDHRPTHHSHLLTKATSASSTTQQPQQSKYFDKRRSNSNNFINHHPHHFSSKSTSSLIS
ncbi:putative phosphatase regulatory subunit-domain-containing protein [Zychaea mexicana]|uniref:putative phosphatase regulatory subunit-domain-containing protein n=1 Tax=Zychaea mexicana TaxID=64656 RepID=UPI0022FF1741|nr:putative phosphatase regulatory subunit-domain-containing protein [Zychaea mexicana]KAI9488601.1 putative phosphatase regulatory subunit-domain-containing protein [Zychaea mexicana]